jgi:hypothetical protein
MDPLKPSGKYFGPSRRRTQRCFLLLEPSGVKGHEKTRTRLCPIVFRCLKSRHHPFVPLRARDASGAARSGRRVCFHAA